MTASSPRSCGSTPRPPTPKAWRRGSSSAGCAPGPGDVLVEVRAAAVNPSDVKAAIGHDALCGLPAHARAGFRRRRGRGPGGPARRGGVRVVRRSRHQARRGACEPSGGRGRRGRAQARRRLPAGGRRDRRALRDGPGGLPPGRHAQARRGRAGHGAERQGRPGRRPDRDVARRAGHRGASARRSPMRATPAGRSR